MTIERSTAPTQGIDKESLITGIEKVAAGHPERKDEYLDTQRDLSRVRENQGLLTPGCRGNAVKAAQQDLNLWRNGQGLPLISESGIYDLATQEAVRDFQKLHAISLTDGSLTTANSEMRLGLVADGVIGPRTLRALDLSLGRETLTFERFKEVTGGLWDLSQVAPGREWIVADNYIPTNLRVEASGISEKLNPEFVAAVEAMATRLGTEPEWMLSVMSFETGGTFSPSKRNKHSGAVGLIQFLKKTAESLGTSRGELEDMTQLEQLEYVEKYLSPYTGRLNSPADLYMAVFCPNGIGKSDSYALYTHGKNYRQNKGLDRNRDGAITKAETAAPVEEIFLAMQKDHGTKSA